MQYRQGDILFISTNDEKPEGLPVTPVSGKVIVAYGEVTGHHHALSASTTQAVQVADRMYLTVAEPTPLTHQEHDAIEIAPGAYWVVYQRQYTRGEVRRVID